MAFRFQKRIKLLPGVKINLSKSGISTSIGPRGAKVTLGHGKVRQTVGLPGTGISHSTVRNIKSKQSVVQSNSGMGFGKLLLIGFVCLFAFMFIFSLLSQ